MIQIQTEISIEPDGITTKIGSIVLQSSNATTKEVNLGNSLVNVLKNAVQQMAVEIDMQKPVINSCLTCEHGGNIRNGDVCKDCVNKSKYEFRIHE